MSGRDSQPTGLASKDVSLQALANARETLKLAKQKLHLYRTNSDGEFLGGMEYTALVKRIEATIGDLEAPSPHDPSVHETTAKCIVCEAPIPVAKFCSDRCVRRSIELKTAQPVKTSGNVAESHIEKQEPLT